MRGILMFSLPHFLYTRTTKDTASIPLFTRDTMSTISQGPSSSRTTGIQKSTTSLSIFSILLLTALLFSTMPTPVAQAETFATTDTYVRFTDVSEEAGFEGVGMSNCAWGDYNNDGYQDLLLNGFRLFENNGPPGWEFTEVTNEAGLTNSYSGVWGDYDNDGFLDLFQVTSNNPADGEKLWRNNGDGSFTDFSAEAGIRDEEDHAGRGVNCGDFDNDGDLDIYVSNYRLHPNVLFENQGDGSFINVAEEKGVEGVPRSDSEGTTRYGHTIGSSWGDHDNDLDLDLFVANLVHKDVERGRYCDDSKMYGNQGPDDDYRFEDQRPGNGMPHKDYMGGEDELWSDCSWGDLDNDGLLDLFITSVYTDIDYAHTYLYMNNGDGSFTDMALGAGVRVWAGWGTSMCDYDQDGDLDIVMGGKDGVDASSNPSRLHLFRNEGVPWHSWLKLEIMGSGEVGGTNRAAIGTRVTVTTKDGISQIREVEGGKGTCANQNSLELEFGFGRETRPVDVEVRFPSGEVFSFGDVGLNQKVTVTEEDGGAKAKLSGVYGGGDGDEDDEYRYLPYVLLALCGAATLFLFSGFRLDERRDYRDEDGVLYGPPKLLVLLACVLLVGVAAGAGVYKLYLQPDDDEGGGSGSHEAQLSPPPPDYLAQAGGMGLTLEDASETFTFSGFTGEDGSDSERFTIDQDNIAFVWFELSWRDEDDLAPPNPTHDNVVKNMGDTFSLLVETPWGESFLSPGPNNYHHREGLFFFNVMSDPVPGYNFTSYPSAPTGGEFTVHIQCLDCGDQREFGNFGPGQTDLVTEDDSNDWDLRVGYAVWVEG